MDGHEDEYDDTLIAFLELIWGEGFLSPGGPEAVRAIVGDIDLTDKLVLDIGCGIGGIDLMLGREFGARVIGLDIEADLVRRARARVERAGLGNRIDCRLTEPGPLPLEDASVDVVFGKDSWIHIADKEGFFAEVFRVLKPGGRLIAGDWTRSDKPYGRDMEYFFELEGLTYHMATLEEYGRRLDAAGFVDIVLEDITADYKVQAHRELADMNGPLKERMVAQLGAESHTHYVENWRQLCVVLDTGELRPGRFGARKPG